jgi:hypothetical protein
MIGDHWHDSGGDFSRTSDWKGGLHVIPRLGQTECGIPAKWENGQEVLQW